MKSECSIGTVSRVYSRVESPAHCAVVVNIVLSAVYANEICPKKGNKEPLRGYQNEAVLATTAAKRAGMKRETRGSCLPQLQGRGSVCQQKSSKIKTPCEHHNGVVLPAPDSVTTRHECMAQQAISRSAPFVSALPMTTSHAAETCDFTLVASSSISSIKNAGLQQLADSGCSSHKTDHATIPHA